MILCELSLPAVESYIQFCSAHRFSDKKTVKKVVPEVKSWSSVKSWHSVRMATPLPFASSDLADVRDHFQK